MTITEFEKTIRAWRHYPSVVVSGVTLAAAEEALKSMKMKQGNIEDMQVKIAATQAALNQNLTEGEKTRQSILNGFRAKYGVTSAEYKEASGN